MNCSRYTIHCVAALCSLTATSVCHGELRIPSLFSDHAVLQADAPVPIWGMAAPNTTVTVAFAGQSVRSTSDANGYWHADLKPLHPSATPADLTIQEGTSAPRVLHDVIVGEVWMACGQSNMAYPLQSMDGAASFLEKADNDQIRFFSVDKEVAPEPLGLHPATAPGDVHGKWVVSNAKTAANFSAVGVLFAQELQGTLHRPVGIIGSNWGGTPIQTWMSLDAFLASPALKPEIALYNKDLAKHREAAADPDAETKYKAVFDQWFNTVGKAHDQAMAAWNKVNESGQDAGPRPPLSQPEPRNPDPIGHTYGSERPAAPTAAYNAMIAPLEPFAVKGVLWYQGEANVGHWQEYAELLPAMVTDWRAKFHQPELRFYVVQLPANGKNEEPRNLPHLRESQATVLTLAHTALAVGFDVGDAANVHPKSKVAIAHRLTLDALGEAYGQKVAYRGPVPARITAHGDVLQVQFADDGGGLVIGQSPWLAIDAVQFPKDHLVGFEIAGKDGVFAPAQAEIHGYAVMLHAESVKQPVSVRYAWDQSPQANLYDDAGLPAAPFRAGITMNPDHEAH